MTKRVSSKERIRQKADEAAAGEKEKAKKKAEKRKSATSSTKASAAVKRQKIVWKVFDEGYKEVASFPYAEKAEAGAKADDLAKKKNKSFLMRAVKVPMEEE